MDLRLEATPETVDRARHALDGLGLPEGLLEDARLLVSELVSNSVRHAGLGPEDNIHVHVDWSGRLLRVSVRDRPDRRSPSVVAAIRPAPGAQSGWGLYLVDRLATRWGADRDGGYWFELVWQEGGGAD